MKALLPLVSCFLTVGSVAVAALHVVPQAVRSCELSPWKLMESTCHLSQEKARSNDLSQKNRIVLESLQAKSAVVDELLQERITLDEAAERFRKSSEASSQFDWALFRRQFAGANDQERFCRQVLSHVSAALREEPERRAELLDRFEKGLSKRSEIIACIP